MFATREVSRSVLTHLLPLLSLMIAACGQDGGADVFLELDRSGCKTTCELVRFDLELQRDDAPGGACAIHQSTQLTEDLELEVADLELGEQVTAVIAAYCRVGQADEVVGGRCCTPLAKCLEDVGMNDPDCVQAREACPAKGGDSQPWEGADGAASYFERWCTLRESCVQCFDRTSFSVTDGQRVDLALQPASLCAGPGSLAPCS